MKKLLSVLSVMIMLMMFVSPVYAGEANASSTAFNENDAKKVYEEFYNNVKYTKDNKEWDDAVFIQYQLFVSDYVEWFEKFVKGGTQEEFLKMSLFDRFLWAETYLRFAWGGKCREV